ncbi:MAG TPA: bifunctional adenosylcobinamide kinase/adenosylcobinamide-phosphate guanylyltransferase [Jatrophihabitantaceae bacterium]|jgi:adenosylcobinamide kinase/adenosylcobinamide-phosphate guanylyltransferase|nr:bifunctional adenosylcobinamide kinase/adenosylcobinamide-phosphate guanylyltransferase [Jatrophihabitantaceae bacterium]
MTESGSRVLVLGGARSGKSAQAEALLGAEAEVDYVAFARPEPEDAEWAERIARHREHRPDHWRSIDVADAADVADVLASGGGAVLLDSVTSWLDLLMRSVGLWDGVGDAKDRLAADIDRFVGAWAATTRRVVAVSDEIGSGLAPEAGPRRVFRDVLGLLNQRMAASSDEVWLVTAGITQRLR